MAEFNDITEIWLWLLFVWPFIVTFGFVIFKPKMNNKYKFIIRNIAMCFGVMLGGLVVNSVVMFFITISPMSFYVSAKIQIFLIFFIAFIIIFLPSIIISNSYAKKFS